MYKLFFILFSISIFAWQPEFGINRPQCIEMASHYLYENGIKTKKHLDAFEWMLHLICLRKDYTPTILTTKNIEELINIDIQIEAQMLSNFRESNIDFSSDLLNYPSEITELNYTSNLPNAFRKLSQKLDLEQTQILANQISDFTDTYEETDFVCFGYALSRLFGLGEELAKNSPFNSKYVSLLIKNHLQEISVAEIKTQTKPILVIYYGMDSILPIKSILHAGILQEDNRVKSVFGTYKRVYIHPLFYVPENYGDEIKLFIPKEDITWEELFKLL